VNLISFKASVPANTLPGAPVIRRVKLPGPFIVRVQVLTNLYGDTGLRFLQGPELMLPDPSAQVLDNAAPQVRQDDNFFYPASVDPVGVGIVVPNYLSGLCAIELVNSNGSTAAAVVVNLTVSAKPPDQEAIELMREMKAGLDRWPIAQAKLMREVVDSMMERQSLPR
jgi:hypothetical protein